MFALLDMGSFAATALPPIANTSREFTVVAVDFKKVYDQVQSLLEKSQPAVAAQLEAFAARVKTKTRLRLKEDVLGRMGPKVAFYTVPAAKTALNFGLMVPKATFLVDVADPVAMGKALDELVLMANKEFKAAFAEPPPPADDEGNGSRPGRRGGGGAGGGGDNRRPAPPPEFRVSVGGGGKSYVLNLPPIYAALTNLQLTISLGKKHIAISTSSAAAKEALALETQKDGVWKPSADVAAAFERLPKSLLALRVSDPSESLPTGLATLPSELEKALNAAIPNPALAAAGSNSMGQPPRGDTSGGRQGLGVPGGGSSRPGGGMPPPGAGGRAGGGSRPGGGINGGGPGGGPPGGQPAGPGNPGDSAPRGNRHQGRRVQNPRGRCDQALSVPWPMGGLNRRAGIDDHDAVGISWAPGKLHRQSQFADVAAASEGRSGLDPQEPRAARRCRRGARPAAARPRRTGAKRRRRRRGHNRSRRLTPRSFSRLFRVVTGLRPFRPGDHLSVLVASLHERLSE